MNKLTMRAVLVAVFCNVLFGSAFPMIKLGYKFFNISDDVFSKILYAGIRFFISGIVVFVVDMLKHKKTPVVQKGNRLNVLLIGLSYTFLQYIFFYIGLSYTTGAAGSVVNSASVFIAIVLAHFVYPDDKFNFKKIAGCIIGFSGVILACFANDGAVKISFYGEGFVLIAGIFFVIGSIINKKASQIDNNFIVTAYNLIIGGSLMILTGILGYNGEITVTFPGVIVLVYLVLVSSVGFTLWSALLRNYPISKLSVYNFVIPVSGTMLSGLLLKENVFAWQYVVALFLVSLGIYIVNYISKNSCG